MTRTRWCATPWASVVLPSYHAPANWSILLQIDISDDGSTVAFAAFANETINGNEVTTARAYGIDAQVKYPPYN
jgi:hypothetical protein